MLNIFEIKLIIKRVLLSLILFAFCRLLFGIYNYEYLSVGSAVEIVYAYLLGLRFDLSIALISNAVPLIFSLIFVRAKKTQKYIYVLLNTAFLSVLIVDIEFFSFIGKKITFDIFSMQSDIEDQMGQLALNYWPFPVLLVLLVTALIKFYPRDKQSFLVRPTVSLPTHIILSFFLLGLSFIGIRGGLQMRSLSPKNAFVHKHFELGNLTLNSAYTLIRSWGKQGLPKVKYYDSFNSAKKKIKTEVTFNESIESSKPNNVVIIILESFSQEYIDQGYAPFLSSLIKGPTKTFANGRRSIEALPSILTGFPSLIGKPLYQSQFQANKYIGLPQYLAKSGYRSYFFHGGKKGTMDFDAYCGSIGFNQYYSKDDYPNQDHYDGHWGIFDNYYFDFFSQKLDQYQQPFMSTIFTLSSHQPYKLPKEAIGKFKKGSLEIHESIGYVDNALKDFFKRNQNKSWFKDTLFIITADHTQKSSSKKYKNIIGSYRVPIIFYHPSKILNFPNNQRIVQHADILPSILDFVGIKTDDKLLFGNSVFSNSRGLAINYISDHFYLITDEGVVSSNLEQEKFFNYDYKSGSLRQNKSKNEDLAQLLKAYIYYTYQGLNGNKIYNSN